MFGIGMPELILILVVALIVIGPKKLPEMARSLGKALNEFKNATQDFKSSLDNELKNNKTDQSEINRIEQRYKEKTAPGPEDVKPGEEQAEAAEKEQTDKNKDERRHDE